MNKTLLTILTFTGLLLFIISPFAALASLMLILLVGAFFWTLWTIGQAIVGSGDTKSDSP